MDDRYVDVLPKLARLIREDIQYGSLIIAFDFDNTIHDYHNVGDNYPRTIKALNKAQLRGHTLVLFTSNPDTDFCLQYCKGIGLDIKWVNKSPIAMGGVKPYYNLLLDDRAGLGEALKLLEAIL